LVFSQNDIQHLNVLEDLETQHLSIGVEGAKTPTGTARAEAPGLSVVREKAEAVPVESVGPETEIDDFLLFIALINLIIWIGFCSFG
jgi:hypothetical protein